MGIQEIPFDSTSFVHTKVAQGQRISWDIHFELQMYYCEGSEGRWRLFNIKERMFSVFTLYFMVLLAIARCAEKNKATHVRVQDRSEPIKLNLDDSVMKNYSSLVNNELYKR